MTLETAIKELETFRQINIRSLKPTLSVSIKLGIEALKRHAVREHLTFAGMMQPLPGETTEEHPGLKKSHTR